MAVKTVCSSQETSRKARTDVKGAFVTQHNRSLSNFSPPLVGFAKFDLPLLFLIQTEFLYE